MDKGYYDYDYKIPDEKIRVAMQASKNEDELMDKLNRMGFGKKKLTPEELQAEVMEEESK